jgi:hypothetical protein
MQKKPTPGMDDKDCIGPFQKAVSSFGDELSVGYRAMATDCIRESEALEWSESTVWNSCDEES